LPTETAWTRAGWPSQESSDSRSEPHAYPSSASTSASMVCINMCLSAFVSLHTHTVGAHDAITKLINHSHRRSKLPPLNPRQSRPLDPRLKDATRHLAVIRVSGICHHEIRNTGDNRVKGMIGYLQRSFIFRKRTGKDGHRRLMVTSACFSLCYIHR
jgi:hypothetical protein